MATSSLTENVTDQPDLQMVKKKTIQGALSYFSRTLLLQGIGLGSTLVLSAALSPSDFGIFGIVVQIIGLLTFFSDIGLAAALIQKKSEPTVDDYRTAFTLQQALSWLIFLVTVVIAWSGLLAAKTGPTGNWILISLGLSFPLATLKTVPSIMLERRLDFSKLVVPQIIEQLLFHGVLITAVLQGYGVLSYVPAILLRSIGGVIAMTWLQPWRFGIGMSRDALKGLLGFGVKFQLNDLLARIKDQLYFLVLGYFFGPQQFGYIQWAKNWSLYPYNLTVQNVMALTFPSFARLQHDHHALRRAIEKSLYFITLAIFPVLTGMCVFIFPALQVFPVYAKWEPAAWSLILFTASIAGSAISTPLTNTLNAIGKIGSTLKLMLFWTGLTWMLTPIAILYFGYTGVAMAALLISLTSILPVYLVKKIVKIAVMDQIWRQFVAAVCMAVVGLVTLNIWSMSALTLLTGMLVVTVIYGAVFFALDPQKFLREFASLRT